MKIFAIVFCLLLTFCQQTFAMLAISDQMIGAAQEYGRSKAAVSANELQKPWTVNEALKENIYADIESIIVYTPYLIVAMDAQNKAKAFDEIKLEDSRNLAAGYDQALVIGAIIDAPEKLNPANLQVVLLQGDKKLLPYYGELISASSTEKVIEKTAEQNKNITGVNHESDKTQLSSDKEKKVQNVVSDKINVKMPIWNLQYYFYFDISQVNATLPFIIKIDDKIVGQREFRLHLGNMN